MKRKRILSLLLALSVMATMLMAVPLTGYAATESTYSWTASDASTTIAHGTYLLNNSDVVVQTIFKDTSTDATTSTTTASTSSTTGTANDTAKATVASYTYCIPIRTKGTMSTATTISSPVIDNVTSVVYSDRQGVIAGIYVSAIVGGTAELYFATGSDSSRTVTVYDVTSSETKVTKITNLGDNSTSSSTKGSIFSAVFTAEAGHEYVAYTGNYGAAFLEAKFTPASTDPSLTLSADTLSLNVGDTSTLTATTANITNPVVTWSSSDTGVATVGETTGVVTGVSAGSATITASVTGGELTEALTAECAVTVTDTATVTYSIGDSGADGTVPASETVSSGDTITIPTNSTLYRDGYTLTGWNDGTTTYAVGSSMTVSGDVTLTPVFTENTVKLGDYSTIVTYQLGKNGGAPSIDINGTGFVVYQATMTNPDTSETYTIDVKMDVNGRLYNANRTDKWCQINKGTVISVPVIRGSVVTVGDCYKDTDVYTINSVENTGDSGYETVMTDGTCDIVLVDTEQGYWESITVVYPQALESPFEDWYLGYNSAGTVGTATVSGDEVTIDTLNIYKILDEPINNGTVTFSADVSIESASANAFRIYLENENASYYQNNSTTSNDMVIAEAVHFGALSTSNSTYGIYVGPTLTDQTTSSYGSYSKDTWYHIEITMDYTKTENPIHIDITTDDGATEVVNTDIGTNSVSSTALNQIRLIRRSTGTTWKNLTITTTSAFGTGASDSGVYEDANSQTVGVIRFLQEYTGAAVSDYGFYIVDSATGEITVGDTSTYDGVIESDGQTAIDSTTGGFYADLNGIDLSNETSRTYYAKSYATIDGITTMGDIIEGTVSTSSPEVTYSED